MPFLRLTLAGSAPDPALCSAAAAEAAALMADILGKRRELTSVLVERLPQAIVHIGDALPPLAAHLEANITLGTNSEEEKRRFIAAAFALLERYFGSLPEATYVILRDVPATDWGYAGRTQAERKAARVAA